MTELWNTGGEVVDCELWNTGVRLWTVSLCLGFPDTISSASTESEAPGYIRGLQPHTLATICAKG